MIFDPSTIGHSADGSPPHGSVGRNFGDSAVRLFGAAALLLGWRPWEFWESTPAELAAALQPAGSGDGPDAEAIAELMRRFPDERDDNG